VVTFAAGAGHLRHPGAYFSVGAIALIAVGALAMVAAVWVAQALGALLPSPLTPPIVAVVGVVAVSLLPALISDQDHRPGVVLLFPALQGPRDHGFAVQMLSTQVVALQVAWLAAVAAAGLALFAAGGTRARLAALLPVALGAAIVAPALPDRLSDAWVEDPTATAVVCSAGDPQVCISRAHAYALAYVVGPAHEALSVMATKLALTANRVVVRDADSRLAPDPQPADEILTSIPIFDDLMTDYTPDNLLHSMLAGAGTRPCGNQAGYDPAKYGESQPNIRYPAAREVAAEWLLDTTPRPASKPDDDPASALVTQTLAALHALPLTEQRDRIAALRAAELTCVAGDRLDLLKGGGSR
jgi:hypothetical protein